MKLRNNEIALDVINYGTLAVISFIMVYPFLNVLAVSLSDYSAYIQNPMMIWPQKMSLAALKSVFGNELILTSYSNTILITVIGTFIDLCLLLITAYPLSKAHLRGKKIFMGLIIFTMLFNGGLIPNFYLVKNLGLLDTQWALILPRLLMAFNIILLKNFFENLPLSLEEAAKIDGASDFCILYKIMIPLSKPILATLALFIAVGYWNSFFEAVIYIRDPQKWTLQLVLREIIMAANTQMLQTEGNLAEMSATSSVTVKYATLIVAILPIVCVYPFLQKYFVKGIMVGAVKG